MARFKIHFISITLFFIALIFAGRLPAYSDSSKKSKPVHPVYDASYRSPASRHKIVVQSNEQELRDSILQAGGSVIEDYGAFQLMNSPEDAANQVSIQSSAGSSVRDDLNLILLRAHTFDTTIAGSEVTPFSLGEPETADQQLYQIGRASCRERV